MDKLAPLLLGICLVLAIIIWRQRRALAQVVAKRQDIVGEEERMFSFLHELGGALQASRTQSEFYQFILNGAMRVIEADHGALYLLDSERAVLVPKAISSDCPPLTADLLPEYEPDSAGHLVSQIKLRQIAVDEENALLGDGLQDVGEGIHLDRLATHAAYASLPDSERAKLPKRALIAPLRFGEQDLGVLVVIGDGAAFDANDFAVFCSLADQCALALGTADLSREAANQRRLERELVNAREVQRILLPDKAPPLSGFRIAGNNRAARTVSGDYYDFLSLSEDSLGIAIADVSGKGLPASLMMAMGRSVLRANAEPWFSPAKAMGVVNRILYPDMREDMFVSMVYLIAKKDHGEIMLARAGHDPPLLYRAATQTIEEINPGGLAVGVDEGPVFDRCTKDFTLTLETGDCLLLYTDGMNEAQNQQGDEWGLDRLRETFLAAAPQGADHVLSQLYEKVGEFVGEFPQTDDMTLVVLEKT